ncbi:MAG: hypothetical protein MK081_13030 [Flavobacteriales bacterium]|nr:hypothetical protein [Flavobacteriales bacterium]
MNKLFKSLTTLCAIFASSVWLSAQVNVTIQVDMSEQTVSGNGVHVAGDFQGWDPAMTPLADQGGGIWSTTISIVAGSTINYKYINGNAWGLDESVPGGCAVGGNRAHTVGMSDETLDLVCFGACTVCAPVQSNVTLQVDMTGIMVDPAGVHVTGEFQGWDPGATPMADQGGGIWSVTVPMDQGLTLGYKFLNGNVWGQDETVPVECATDNNRTVTVGVMDQTEDVVCFGSCAACVVGAVPGCTNVDAQNYDPAATEDDGSCEYLITFQVDMNQVCLTAEGVHIAGSIQGWDPAATAMDDSDMDGVFTYSAVLTDGAYEYKYINGNAWGQDELVPGACAVNNNRELVVAGANQTIPVVCFASCDPCGAAEDITVTLQVDMSDETTDASGIHVVGTFNSWDPMADPMVDAGGGIYTKDITVPSGTGLQYRFVNGNTSMGEEVVPMECGSDDMQGGGVLARTIDCVSSPTVINPVCFGGCDACSGSLVNVTFQVDMSNEVVNPIGVFIVGSFQDPPFTAGLDQMTDLGGGIWEFTTAIATGTSVTYKYLNGPNFANEEIVPANCGLDNGFGGFDREWTVGAADETIPGHCFSSCVSCDTPDVNVTFQVDMSEEPVAPEGVHIAGAFQGWDPGATLMVDQGNGIWTYTASLTPGESVEYKFINGNVWGQDESVPGECASGFNRSHTPGGTDETVPVVCFASCQACNVPSADVTFEVDMTNEMVDPTGVYLVGNFNGFDASATPLTDMGGGVWAVTVMLDQDASIEYKYLNGSDFAGEETVPMECGVDNGFGGYNRAWTVGMMNETIPVHCFSSCDVCVVGVPGCTDMNATNFDPLATIDNGSCTYNVTFRVDMWNEMVDANGVYIVGDFQGWNPTSTPMNYLGYGIYEFSSAFTGNSTLTFKFVNGNDIANAESVPVECGTDDGFGGYNRIIELMTSDVSVSVCFGECDACAGCTDPFSTEYNPFAISDDASCVTPVVYGCTYVDAENYDVSANEDDGSCTFQPAGNDCPEDLNSDGIVNAADLLQFLAGFGTPC